MGSEAKLTKVLISVFLIVLMATGYGGLCGKNDKDTSSGTSTSANNPPVLAAIGDKTVNEGQTLGFTISATDPDGDALTYNLTGLPAGYTLNAATGVFSWTPSFIQSDSYTVIFTVTDTKGATDDETITITVQNVPPPAQVTSPDPANEATNTPITQQLSWAAASGAASYDVYFSAEGGSASGGGIPLFAGNTVTNTYSLSTLNYNTTYYWRIDSKNTARNTQGVVWSFTTASPTLPPQVTSPDPANDATDVPITQQLSWASATGAASYDVYLGTTSSLVIPVQTGIQITSYNPGALSYATQYYWRIDSKNTAGTTTGLVWSFTTAAPTLPPQVTSPDPANGATDVPITTTQLSWFSASGATSYQIQVATDSNFTNIVTSSVIASVSVAIPSLQYSTTYYWRIDSKNTAGTTQGLVWSFTTAASTLPPQVTTPDPANGTTDVPITQQLSWAVASGATSYDVYLGTTSSLVIPVQTGIQTTSYNPGALSYATPYYWRIDSKNYTGTTQGLVWTFGTAASTLPPAQVTSPDPANGATDLPITQQLSWAVASGAASYDVYFGTTNPPPLIGNQTGVTYNPGTLAYNALYYRRIDSKNSTGTTTGMVWPFTTQVAPSFPPAQVTTPTPANGATGVPVTQQLSWAPASGAASYDVHFGAIIANSTVTTYTPAGLTPDTTYNWRIDSKNTAGNTQGLDWSFTTSPLPALVTSPNPANGAANVITTTQLSWAAVSGVTSYDVYFGTSATPPFINNQTTTSYILAVLSCRTTYYWRIDPKNVGGTSAGTVWSFTTVPLPPGPITAPLPPDGASGISILTQLQWSAPTSFPAYAESYDVYFGTTIPVPLVAGGIQTTSYNPGLLLSDTVYYWRIDTKNFTATTPGTVYSFTAVNHAPILTAIGDKTVNEAVLLTFSISATDPEGYPITYSATGLPGGAAFDAETQTFSWTTGYSDAAVYPGVKFRATDIGGVYAEETIAITVNNVDRPPVLTAVGNKSVNEDSTLTFSLTASDPDLDIIAYSATELPPGASLNSTNGNFTWTLSYDDAGVYPCTFTATSNTLSDFEAITITVTNVDRPPVLAWPGDKTVIRGQLLAFSLAADDPDLDTIVYSKVFTPTGETLNPSTGAFAWTPALGSYAGTYPATFTAMANTMSDSRTISITVDAFGAPAQLTWVTPQPQGTAVSATMPAFAVRVQDQFGNYVPAVTVAITATDPTRVVYQAGVRVTTYATADSDANGLATFSAISMTQAGAGYRFRASSGALTPVNSDAFDIFSGSLSNSGGGDWQYSRPITVTNNSGADLTDYQVLLEPFRDSGDFSGDNLNNTGLVGCWSMSEGTGATTADASGSGNNGTLATSPANPTWTQGRFGNALSFDGTDYVYKDSGVSGIGGTNQFTMELWVKRSATQGTTQILWAAGNLSAGTFMVIQLGSTNKIWFDVNNAGTERYFESTNTLTDTSSWHHIVATYNAGTEALYVDGVPWAGTTAGALTGNSGVPANYLGIGSYYTAAGWSASKFSGQIDEVKVWNRALTAEEAATRYGSGLVGSWHFSEGTGQSALDMSGNGNNGQLGSTSGADANDPTWSASGRFGNALSFDGTDDRVTIADSANWDFGTGNFSIEGWFNANNLISAARVLVSARPFATYGWMVWLVDATTIGVQSSDPTNNYFTVSLSTGTWYYFVVVRDGNNLKLYLNNELKGTINVSGQTFNNTNNVGLGIGALTNGGYYFNGLIDEVRLYNNRALSAAEITTRYNGGTPKVKHDFADVRFTNADATAEYNYWQETDSRFWVKVPSLPATQSSLRLYYGNVSATASSSGANTFDFFDDFSGDLSKWSQTGSVWSITSGVLKSGNVGNPGDSAYLRTLNTIANINSTETIFRARYWNTSADPGTRRLAFGSGTDSTPFYTEHDLNVLFGTTANNIYWDYNDPSPVAIATTEGAWYKLKSIRYSAGTSKFGVYTGGTDALLAEKTDTVLRGTESYMAFGMPFFNMDVDWIFVRKYSAVEPASAPPGPEQ